MKLNSNNIATLLLEFNFSSFCATMHWSCPITGESKWDRVSTLACGDDNLAGVVHWSDLDLLDLSKVVWMLIMLDPTGVVQRSIVSDSFEIFVGLCPSM